MRMKGPDDRGKWIETRFCSRLSPEGNLVVHKCPTC